MPEYIEREAILKHTTSVEVGAFSEWDVVKVEHIKNAPAADVVEVVRCKDCKKHYKDGFCDVFDVRTKAKDYCSYGERRSEE